MGNYTYFSGIVILLAMKRAVIVHCWSGTPNYCWYPWVKQALEKRGFQVTVPAMPETDLPQLKLWLPKLKEIVGEPDEELYLIGHSAGSLTIMRYLEQMTDVKVAGVALVAGFTDDLGYEELANFFATPFDFEAIKRHVDKGIALIHSDNDPYVPVKYGYELANKLAAELAILPAKGHFSGPIDEASSCRELPEVIEAIEEMETA